MTPRRLLLATALLACRPGPSSATPPTNPDVEPASDAAQSPKRDPSWWVVSISIPGGRSLALYVSARPGKTGGYEATVDIPVQGVKAMKLDRVEISATRVEFELGAPIGAKFGGTHGQGPTTCSFEQQGVKLECTLESVTEQQLAQRATPARPQTPKPPFPYEVREVEFRNDDAQIKLAGTLTVPKGSGPYAAAVMITGSGSQDRDETLFHHKPFAVIADHLTRNGFAVLRFDDRGMGGSEAGKPGATSEDFAGDVRAAVAFARTAEGIDGLRVGLIGHSEGGIIAPLVAAKDKKIAFVVLLAGPGVPGHEIIVRQVELITAASGMNEGAVKVAKFKQRQIVDAVMNGATEAELRKLMPPGAPKTQVDLQLKQVLSPWYKRFLTLDPRDSLRKVKCPVLALGGSLDLQVDVEQNLPEIRKALKKARNRRVTIKTLEGHNHLFQSGAKTGSVAEYSELQETFSQEALAEITRFLKKHVAK